MTAAIEPMAWLGFIEREYLSGFISDGGSSIKFAVPLDDVLRSDLSDGLAAAAERLGYLVVYINATETKVHMMDEIFFRAASQIPWQHLSRRVIAELAADAGYDWAEVADVPLFQQLADANGVEPQMLLLELKQAIGRRVFKEHKVCKDFRVAMTHMCLAELSGGQDGAMTSKVLIEWLTGQNKAISPLKPYQVFRRINRATARYFFQAMVQWIRLAQYPGILIILDAARLMLARNPHDQGHYYTKAAVLDAYEVLRQFIDGADQLTGCMLVVVPAVSFLEDHTRGLGAYEALKFRVFDEVRDRRFVNPMASLVRLSHICKVDV
jgi:hypothetical protein